MVLSADEGGSIDRHNDRNGKVDLRKFSMQSIIATRVRSTEFAKVIDTEDDLKEFQQHLKEVVEGAAFRGSQRSGQFLRYIVDQAIAGHFDALKERSIGVELFKRSPTYDTGEDAIVRVTASDVRRRLLQHYGSQMTASEFRIGLPPGNYIPEITRQSFAKEGRTLPVPIPVAPEKTLELPPVDPQDLEISEMTRHFRRPGVNWLLLAGLFVLLNIAVWIVFGGRLLAKNGTPAAILPWSTIFHLQHATFLVTCDPNIAEIQGLTGLSISASEYANQQYLPQPGSLPPDVMRIIRDVLRGDKAANVDTPIVASVAALAQANAEKISVRPARELRLADLDTDNNFIFLGSPRSNPWTSLFSEQLDFKIIFDKASHQEIILNQHPHIGEPMVFVPTAKGFATGNSFAVISFVQNPNHAGQILMLAGANAEGTKAAGELVTDMRNLSTALDHCGIHTSDPVQHFQILLRLQTMAGSPTSFDVASCHLLP